MQSVFKKRAPTEEDAPLTTTTRRFFIPVQTRYRWVILGVYAVLAFLQNAVWNTWGPISGSATKAIGFTQHDYEMLLNWGAIAILVAMPPFAWLMNTMGPRMPILAGGSLVFVGTVLRCLPLQPHVQKYVIHFGQLLNSIGGCPVLSAAPLISNIWFPSSERITATSCMLLLGNLGNGFSYLVGPAVVDGASNCTVDSSGLDVAENTMENSTANATMQVHGDNKGCGEEITKLRKQIGCLMYIECGFALAVLIMLFTLFKNMPDEAPSASAREERLGIWSGLKSLSKNVTYWIIVVAYCLVEGAYLGWYGLITVLYLPQGISQVECGQVVFAMTVLGTACGIAVGWFADRLKGQMKWILFASVTALFFVFLYLMILLMRLLTGGPLAFSKGGVFVGTVMVGMLASSIEPVAAEMAADIGFPVNEGTSSSILAWFSNLFMFLFLLTLTLTKGEHVAYYLFLGFVGVAAPMIAFCTTNQNKRMNFDRDQSYVMTHERIVDD